VYYEVAELTFEGSYVFKHSLAMLKEIKTI